MSTKVGRGLQLSWRLLWLCECLCSCSGLAVPRPSRQAADTERERERVPNTSARQMEGHGPDAEWPGRKAGASPLPQHLQRKSSSEVKPLTSVLCPHLPFPYSTSIRKLPCLTCWETSVSNVPNQAKMENTTGWMGLVRDVLSRGDFALLGKQFHLLLTPRKRGRVLGEPQAP